MQNNEIFNIIKYAIGIKMPIEFVYEDETRIGNAHIIFACRNKTKENETYVEVWQTGGYTSSGKLPIWRPIIFNKITFVKILEKQESFCIAEGYNFESPRHEIIFAEVTKNA